MGLQRGWNSALDATFCADNIYNNKTFNGKAPSKDEPIEGPIEWSEHLDNMMNLMTKLGNNSRESKLSEEMNIGLFNEKGPVVTQIRRQLKAGNVEAPVPAYLPTVEPWFRYKEFDLTIKKNYQGRDLFDNIHPLATRELAIFHRNEKYVDKGAYIKKKITRPTAAMLTWPKRFECSAFWCDNTMKLLQIDGKTAPGEKVLASSQPDSDEPAPKEEAPPKINPEEVKHVARRKSNALRDHVLQAAMSGPSPSGLDRKDRSGLDALIFAGKDKAKQAFEKKEGISSSEPASSPPPKWRPSGGLAQQRASILTPTDVSAIANLTARLDSAQIGAPAAGAGFTGAGDPLYSLRLQQVKYEKETTKAKLLYAEKEAVKVKVEQEALDAKMAYAKKEVDMLNALLNAYADAEAKLRDMA